jgi:hypothetical protein
MAQAHDRAVVARDYSDVATVGNLSMAAINKIQRSQSRILDIERQLVLFLENKPFGLPLTADEKQGFNFLKGEIAKSANATPTSTPQVGGNAVETDQSMKRGYQAPTPRPKLKVRYPGSDKWVDFEPNPTPTAQETYPHAKAVSPKEMAAPPAPAPH